MKAKMERVLETVAAYPAPATDQELNSRLSTVVEKVVDKQLSAALSKHEDRLVAVEKSSMKSIQNLDGLVDDIAKRHNTIKGSVTLSG